MYTKKELGERSLSMESGYFARKTTTILTHGNINVGRNKISLKGLRRQGKFILPRNTVSEKVLWFWVGTHRFFKS